MKLQFGGYNIDDLNCSVCNQGFAWDEPAISDSEEMYCLKCAGEKFGHIEALVDVDVFIERHQHYERELKKDFNSYGM